jgi:hypothetical protein
MTMRPDTITDDDDDDNIGLSDDDIASTVWEKDWGSIKEESY